MNRNRIILIFGLAAGLAVAVPMCLMVANSEHGSAATSLFAGYLVSAALLRNSRFLPARAPVN